MRRSRYSLAIDDFPDIGKTLLFSTLTRAQVVVDAELRSLVGRLPDIAVPPASADALAKLEKLGILSADEAGDEQALEAWFRKLRAGDGTLKPTVLTTYSCNLACPYCVEEGVKEPVFMDEETVRDTASFILRRRRELGSPRVALEFYGGEPLLNPKAMIGLATLLREGCAADGVPFCFGVVTNGTLLAADLVRQLASLGLVGVKVTIDGDREAHDRTRPYRGGRGSFDVILANLQQVAGLTRIDVGVNLDGATAATVPRLLDELERRGLRKHINRMLFKPVSPAPADRRRLAVSAEISCAWNDAATMGSMVALRDLAAERGFGVEAGIGSRLCDAISNPGAFTIDPKGVLYRCAGFVGNPAFVRGDIHSGEKAGGAPGEPWRRCSSCPMVPLCGDGCPFEAWVLKGDADALVCGREAIEQAVTETIKSDYRRSHRGARR